MRSRSTNFLQAVVLLNALVFVFIGMAFFLSPLTVLKIFAENVSENWLDLVMDNELVAPLYFISRGFAALLITSGAAMILPLFDPLRYRGLIYFDGVFFPLLASILFLKNGIALTFFKNDSISPVNVKPVVGGPREGHIIILVMGIIFILVFTVNIAALLITRKQAQEGIE